MDYAEKIAERYADTFSRSNDYGWSIQDALDAGNLSQSDIEAMIASGAREGYALGYGAAQ